MYNFKLLAAYFSYVGVPPFLQYTLLSIFWVLRVVFEDNTAEISATCKLMYYFRNFFSTLATIQIFVYSKNKLNFNRRKNELVPMYEKKLAVFMMT